MCVFVADIWHFVFIKNFEFEAVSHIFLPLYNLKNVKNTHGGVLLLVKLQATQNIEYVMKI